MGRPLALFIVLFCSGVVPLQAQHKPSSLSPGTRIRIASPLFHGTGLYQGSRADTLLVRTAAGDDRAVPVDSIWRLDRSLGRPSLGRGLGRGALVGGAGGALGGAAGLGLMLVLFCEPGSCTAEDWVVVMGVGAGVVGAIGAVAGGVVGVVYEASRGERWERVPLPEGLAFSIGAGGSFGFTIRR